jgi:hypothetical protein
MSATVKPQPVELEIRDYSPDLRAGVLEVLHEGFGQKWGDDAFWQWKHSSRPGFSPSNVAVFTSQGDPVGCFHLVVRSIHLAPGLDVRCSVEGDFAIRKHIRGSGLPQRAYRHSSHMLADQSVVLRCGFSSPELYEHVYKPKFGHRMMPSVTAQYRKVISDRLLREKMQELGEKLRQRVRVHRMVARRPLTVHFNVAGFQPFDLIVAKDSASCSASLSPRPDLKVRAPYALLAVGRMPRPAAAMAVAQAVLSGKAWVSGLVGSFARYLAR